MHFGDWELQRFDRIADQDRLRAFWDAPGDVRPPGGESWHEISARVGRAVARLRAAHPGRDIIAVAHMGTILTQVQAALGITAFDAFGHRIDNLSVTQLHWQGSGWGVARVNHCP
jgi:broad specificity phosphatase PhoE